MTEMMKCEICGKLYPRGSVCCAVGKRNEPVDRDTFGDNDFR